VTLHGRLGTIADIHEDVLKYLLPSLPKSLLSQTNENDSPPLHWAILNNHVAVVQLLVDIPEEQGGGLPLLKVSSIVLSIARQS
jgi:ankyrin repeat protein